MDRTVVNTRREAKEYAIFLHKSGEKFSTITEKLEAAGYRSAKTGRALKQNAVMHLVYKGKPSGVRGRVKKRYIKKNAVAPVVAKKSSTPTVNLRASEVLDATKLILESSLTAEGKVRTITSLLKTY